MTSGGQVWHERWGKKNLRLMVDLRILKCSHIPSIRRIILIYIKPRCPWYVWTIPPLSGATEEPWITPQGCQHKKRQEGLRACWYYKPNCLLPEVKSRQGEGWEYMHTSFIGWQLTFLFSVAQLQKSLVICVSVLLFELGCCENVLI